MNMERILSFFSLFTDLSGEELEGWRSLCDTAGRRVAARLRPGLSDSEVEREEEALCAAAAAWAYCDYLLMSPARGFRRSTGETIRIGDISVGGGSGESTRLDAEEIRDYFLGQVSHLLRVDCPAIVFTEGC